MHIQTFAVYGGWEDFLPSAELSGPDGTLVTWAQRLGLKPSTKLLKQTLNEENRWALSRLAWL